jgi:hypothetical protein
VVRVERTAWVDTLISGGQVTEIGVEDELPFKPDLPPATAPSLPGSDTSAEAGEEDGGDSRGDVEGEASSLGKKGSTRGPKASQRGRKARDDHTPPTGGGDRGEGT